MGSAHETENANVGILAQQRRVDAAWNLPSSRRLCRLNLEGKNGVATVRWKHSGSRVRLHALGIVARQENLAWPPGYFEERFL